MTGDASAEAVAPDAMSRPTVTPSVAPCPVVILCGGQGTRIADVSQAVPKPLLPIGDMPILWHIMKLYSCQGFKDFILCLGHLGDRIEEFFRCDASCRERDQDWTITFAHTGELTPTGGRLKSVEDLVQAETFMLTYGDGLSDVDLRCLLKVHETQSRIATVTAIRARSPFGMLEIEDGIATSFVEKPLLDKRSNGGFFVFHRRVFDYLSLDDALEEGPFLKLVEDGELAVYEHDGFWSCMDTKKDFEALNQIWDSGRAPWRPW
jgi:glucose-1-phosphate cytidylyltransferase